MNQTAPQGVKAKTPAADRRGTPRPANRKAKLLQLQEILLTETDDEHGLTLAELLGALAERGIAAERKAIYDDLQTLRDFGLDIIIRRGPRTEYAIGDRHFELPELLLLVDAVQSSRFLTKTKSEILIQKLQKLVSRHQEELLTKSLRVEGRIKTQNESIYYNIDDIQTAIRQRHQITFKYLEYGLDKQAVLRKQGKQYQENPIELVYQDDYYYLITYNQTHQSFLRYRVDRMKDIAVSSEPTIRLTTQQRLDVESFIQEAFGMFDGETVQTVLEVQRQLIGAIIDRFGKEVLISKLDDSHARIHVSVRKSPAFFGWLAQFGNQIRLVSPRFLAKEYQSYLQEIINLYTESN